MPPIAPEPSHISHSWWVMTPTAEITRPPHQHTAAATPALRGPARSSQPPNTAADEPRNTKNSVYITVTSLTRQSQLVVVSASISDMSLHTTDLEMPRARDSGSQNTLNPYAMPMHRWIASAAGGTSQRLNPGLATMRSRSRRLGGLGSKASMQDLPGGVRAACGTR